MEIAIYVVLPLAGLALGWAIRWLYARFQLTAAERRAESITREALKTAEAKKRELLLEAKEKVIAERNQLERETREHREEVKRYEKRVTQKEEQIDRKLSQIERTEQNLAQKEREEAAKWTAREADYKTRVETLSHEEERYRAELERISGLSVEEAKALIIKDVEKEARHDAQGLVLKIEEEAKAEAARKAQDVLVTTIQRMASDVTGDVTVTTVALPNDEMKGRIIGREGRNIRSLETLTGVDIIIDDTPEAVVISCFDPVRREIARAAMERLVVDGRIHPARIEDIVGKVTRETSQKIFEEGERALFDFGIHNASQDAIKALGRLYFRTSYGQNVLAHSREVAAIAGALAAELGANRELAKRAALLHDIGKGVEADSDLNHAEIGMDMARRMGEEPRVLNAIGSHHNDIAPSCVESVIVQIADAISAARPGARHETIDAYIKRLKNLENIALSFGGVEKTYAIQAGRELRVVVNSKVVSDQQALPLIRDIARKIEADLRYPGRIKVTLIRETRIEEYAR